MPCLIVLYNLIIPNPAICSMLNNGENEKYIIKGLQILFKELGLKPTSLDDFGDGFIDYTKDDINKVLKDLIKVSTSICNFHVWSVAGDVNDYIYNSSQWIIYMLDYDHDLVNFAKMIRDLCSDILSNDDSNFMNLYEKDYKARYDKIVDLAFNMDPVKDEAGQLSFFILIKIRLKIIFNL